MAKDVTLTVRMATATSAALEAEAAVLERSKSWCVERAVEEWLRARGRLQDQPPKPLPKRPR